MNKRIETIESVEKVNKARGDVVISVILVIVILGIIGLFAYKVFNIAMEKTRISSEVAQVQNLSEGIEDLYSNSNDYSSIDTTTVISAGISPKEDVVNNHIITSWYQSNNDSIITVSPSTNPTNFSIDLAAIPSDACSKVGASFLNQGSSGVTANGTVANTPADLAKNCAVADPASLSISF